METSMRKVVAGVMLVGVAAGGWLMAWKGRSEASAAEVTLAAERATAAAVETENRKLGDRLREAQAELLAAKNAKVQAGAGMEGAKKAAAEAPTFSPAVEARPDYFRRVIEDPEVNALYVAQQRLQLEAKYEFLLKALRLTPAEREALLQRLVEKRLNAADSTNVAMAHGLKPNDDAVLQGLDQANADTDRAISALLGEERFSQYQDFDKNIGQWNLLYGLSREIAAASTPLDAAQAEMMMKIFAEPSHLRPVGGENSAAALDAYAARYGDWSRTALDRTGTLLTPEQLAALGKYFERVLVSLKMKAALELSGRAMIAP